MVTADYDYDGLERLAIRTTQNMTPAGTTHYVYDRDGHLIAEATNTGTTTREYVWLDDMPLAVVADVDTANPNLYYVHADHLDRPLKMTDGSEAVVWDAVYNPFGDVNTITGSASNNLRFPGQYFLIEAGLHYNWHRHYDPTLGRYTQTDPLGFVDGSSQYLYVRANPLSHVDPKGLAGILSGPYSPIVSGRATNPQACIVSNSKNGPGDLDWCHDRCSDLALPTGDYGVAFQRCVNQCMGRATYPEWEGYFRQPSTPPPPPPHNWHVPSPPWWLLLPLLFPLLMGVPA